VFLLDTNHLSILQRRTEPEFSRIDARMQRHPVAHFHVSLVSFHEQLLGCHAYVNAAKSEAGVVRGYEMLQRMLVSFATYEVIPFDAPAAAVFRELRHDSAARRVGTMDLRIAATAIARGLVVLTTNTVDFERIPGVPFEDWTAAEIDDGTDE
jgi:tRNA(fMet)-specific endonuclease VapC